MILTVEVSANDKTAAQVVLSDVEEEFSILPLCYSCHVFLS